MFIFVLQHKLLYLFENFLEIGQLGLGGYSWLHGKQDLKLKWHLFETQIAQTFYGNKHSLCTKIYIESNHNFVRIKVRHLSLVIKILLTNNYLHKVKGVVYLNKKREEGQWDVDHKKD